MPVLSSFSATRTRLLATALGVALPAAVLSGCGHHSDATPPPGPDGPACTVAGFAADPAYTVTAKKPGVAIVGTYQLDKGLDYPAQLGKSIDILPAKPGITPTGTALSPTDTATVLASSGAVIKKRSLIDTHLGTIELHNTTTGSVTYVIYTPVTEVHGSYTLKGCGATYNDGSAIVDLAGTYVTYEDPGKPLVVECGTTPTDADAKTALAIGSCP